MDATSTFTQTARQVLATFPLELQQPLPPSLKLASLSLLSKIPNNYLQFLASLAALELQVLQLLEAPFGYRFHLESEIQRKLYIYKGFSFCQ